MRIEGGSPNLINGVSRQPPEVRLVSQLEESVNQFPTASRGLVPRNPAILKGIVPGAIASDTLVHLIDRDEHEQYVALIGRSGIRVFDLEGGEQVVNAPGGFDYLREGGGNRELKALTVQDHTFVLNTGRVVEKSDDRTPEAAEEGLIHVVQGDYFTDYKVFVDGALAAHVQTDGGPYENEGDARKAERGAKTSVIAHMLVNGTPPAGVSTIPGTAKEHLRNTLGSSGWVIEVMDNVIALRKTLGGTFTLEVEAGSETFIRAHKGFSKEMSELPRKAPVGFTLRIAGGERTDYDDYYVQFQKEATDAQGEWREIAQPGSQFKMNAETLPHLLVREEDGSFTFKPAEWGVREAGDDKTNPWPSFVGSKVAGLSFGNNRFGMFSGEHLAQSRSGEFFNFWTESILTLLDTDPVDAAISYSEISTIRHVVPFSGETLLFTDSVPFRLGKGETLTQQNVHYEHLIENKVSKRVRPVAAGSKLFFVNNTPSGSFVHEFSYDRAVDNLSAQSITDHVPGYIPANISLMEADGDLKMLALVSSDDPSTLYTYKWLWIGEEKAQSAWQKWTLKNPVRAVRFYGEELILVSDVGMGWEILSLNCHEAWNGQGLCAIYVDRQVSGLEGEYDPLTNATTYQLPYDATHVIAVSTDSETFGYRPVVLNRAGRAIVIDGDWTTSDMVFGEEFESYGILSPLLHRTTNNQGGYGNAVTGVNTTVASVKLGTGDTAFMRVELSRAYRKPIVYDLSAARVGTEDGRLGPLVIGRASKPVSVMSRSEDFQIKFGNLGPYPYSVMSYGWSGTARMTAY